MKKLLKILSLSFLLLLSSINVDAEVNKINVEKLRDDSVFEEVIKLKDEAKKSLQKAYKENTGSELPDNIEIDLGDSYKLYADSYFFSEIDNYLAVKERLDEVPVIWHYEILINGNIYEVEISKGGKIDKKKSLSREDYEYLKSIEGEWHISGYGYSKENDDTFEERLNKIDEELLKNGEELYLIIGLKMINSTVALLTKDHKPKAIVEIMGEIDIEGNNEYKEQVLYKKGIYNTKAYDFKEMKSIINATNLDDSLVGAPTMDVSKQEDEKSLKLRYVGAAIAIIGVVIVLYKTKIAKKD